MSLESEWDACLWGRPVKLKSATKTYERSDGYGYDDRGPSQPLFEGYVGLVERGFL